MDARRYKAVLVGEGASEWSEEVVGDGRVVRWRVIDGVGVEDVRGAPQFSRRQFKRKRLRPDIREWEWDTLRKATATWRGRRGRG